MLLPEQKQFVEIAFPITHVHDLRRPTSSLQAAARRLKPAQPFHALFFLHRLAIDHALARTLPPHHCPRAQLRIEQTERLPLGTERQGTVQEQPAIAPVAADRPQARRARMGRVIERSGVLHRQDHPVPRHPLPRRPAMTRQKRPALHPLIVKKTVGRLAPSPIPAGPRNGAPGLAKELA